MLKVIRRGVNSCVVTNNPEIQQVLSSFLRERFMVGFKARVPANVLPTTNPTAGFPAPNSDIFQGAFLCSVAVVLFFFLLLMRFCVSFRKFWIQAIFWESWSNCIHFRSDAIWCMDHFPHCKRWRFDLDLHDLRLQRQQFVVGVCECRQCSERIKRV